MFGCFGKIIKTIVLILAIIGFVAIGGMNFILKFVKLPFGNNQENKLEKAEKIADFSKLNEEFEIISSGSIPLTCNYVYVKHGATGQKTVFTVFRKQETLTAEDFSTENANTKIQTFIKNFKFLGFSFENYKIKNKGTLQALEQKIPYVQFEAEVSNLPTKGVQGIIGAAKTSDKKNLIIISFNSQGKYSKIITSALLSEIQLNK